MVVLLLTNNAEIETCLEQYIDPNMDTVLWRRVVVRSGPTCPQQVIHASFMLPDDVSSSTNTTINNTSTSSSSPFTNYLCWTAFPERPDHPLLCVLANPTLLCIWDVYPTTSTTSTTTTASTQQQQENLGSGEGHHIPLPFEASGIFAVGNNQHGLIIQRCETAEDLFAFDRSWNNGGTTTTGGETDGQHRDDDDDDEEDDDGFILKAPPRPVRLRDSTGGSTFASLNMSTATSSPSTTAGGSPSLNVPSLFSLQHPMGDIVPVTTFVDDETVQTGPVTDVFEKILFVGVMKWVDDDPNIPYMDRKERSHPVCVTYHTQLNR